jgi:hypothetical protein
VRLCTIFEGKEVRSMVINPTLRRKFCRILDVKTRVMLKGSFKGTRGNLELCSSWGLPLSMLSCRQEAVTNIDVV